MSSQCILEEVFRRYFMIYKYSPALNSCSAKFRGIFRKTNVIVCLQLLFNLQAIELQLYCKCQYFLGNHVELLRTCILQNKAALFFYIPIFHFIKGTFATMLRKHCEMFCVFHLITNCASILPVIQVNLFSRK